MSIDRKTRIIESLFDSRWDAITGAISNPIVTLDEVQRAIREDNATYPPPPKMMSDRNPANFVKDFIRNRDSANERWPQSVLDRGFTARQLVGGGACFEFIPLRANQLLPFQGIARPAEATPRYRVESASLPLASRRLGRPDETWLTQVLVRLRVFESHLTLFSKRNIIQVDHLQMGIKLGKTEIDALFLAVEELRNGKTRELIVSCEAKGLRDDILDSQVISQVRAVFTMDGLKHDMVMPLAVKTLGPSEVHLVEFDIVSRNAVNDLEMLTVASEAIYTLVPPVPGIGESRKRSPSRRRRKGDVTGSGDLGF